MAVKIQTIDSKCETENLQPHSKTKDKLSQVPRAQILTLPIWLFLILTTVQAMILALDKDKVVEPKLAFVVYESPAANESVLENYRRLTYMLAHDGWSHFLGNVILQLVTGLIISYRIGLGESIVIFLMSTVSGSIAFEAYIYIVFPHRSQKRGLVGASSAIAGLCFAGASDAVARKIEPNSSQYKVCFLKNLPVIGNMLVSSIVLVSDVVQLVDPSKRITAIVHLAGELSGIITLILMRTFSQDKTSPSAVSHESSLEKNELLLPCDQV